VSPDLFAHFVAAFAEPAEETPVLTLVLDHLPESEYAGEPWALAAAAFVGGVDALVMTLVPTTTLYATQGPDVDTMEMDSQPGTQAMYPLPILPRYLMRYSTGFWVRTSWKWVGPSTTGRGARRPYRRHKTDSISPAAAAAELLSLSFGDLVHCVLGLWCFNPARRKPERSV
jgi:hypothetical protein